MPRSRNVIRGTDASAAGSAGLQPSALAATSTRSMALVAAMRPLHWTKNLLLFVPLLLSTEVSVPTSWLQALVGFVAFSLCASSVYVLNDSLDVEADRQHPEKKFRPFAGGAIPVHWARLIVTLLSAMGLSISWWLLPGAFTFLLLGYLVTTSAYSIGLKQVAFLDVIILASFYPLRLIAGGVATDHAVNRSLVVASLFFFASVAFAKRHAELARHDDSPNVAPRCRGYATSDLPLLEAAGIGCGCLAVIAFCRLVIGANGQYRGGLLGLVCTLLLGWLTRVWWLARRRKLLDDPLLFALSDPISLLIGIMLIAVVGISLLHSIVE